MSTSELFHVLRVIKKVIAELEDEEFSECLDAPAMMTKQSTRTPQEARAWLDCQGITIAQWSREHGFNERLVHEVLAGRKRGLRGHSHNIAIALGMKDGIPTDRPARVPPAKRRIVSTSTHQGVAV